MSDQREVAGNWEAADEDSGDMDSANGMCVERGNMACAGRRAAGPAVEARRTHNACTDKTEGDGESHAEVVLAVEGSQSGRRLLRTRMVARRLEGQGTACATW